jgi:acyl-CoA thioesterase
MTFDQRPIYTPTDNIWTPAPEAKGPFPGQHGGAVAGVLAAAMEAEAAVLQAGLGVKLSLNLLRPAPVVPVEIKVEKVTNGRRLTVLQAAMSANDKLVALAHAVFVQPVTIPTLPPTPVTTPVDLASALPAKVGDYSSEPWFWDAIEARQTADHTIWLRALRPIAQPFTPLAQIGMMADWASGFSRLDSLDEPLVAALPNADLTIHLSRQPQGEWIGLRPDSTWHENGLGLTDTVLLDQWGVIGRCCQSLLLLPLPD